MDKVASDGSTRMRARHLRASAGLSCIEGHWLRREDAEATRDRRTDMPGANGHPVSRKGAVDEAFAGGSQRYPVRHRGPYGEGGKPLPARTVEYRSPPGDSG